MPRRRALRNVTSGCSWTLVAQWAPSLSWVPDSAASITAKTSLQREAWILNYFGGNYARARRFHRKSDDTTYDECCENDIVVALREVRTTRSYIPKAHAYDVKSLLSINRLVFQHLTQYLRGIFCCHRQVVEASSWLLDKGACKALTYAYFLRRVTGITA